MTEVERLKDLLGRYCAYVGAYEGIDFLNNGDRDMEIEGIKLAAAECNEIKTLAEKHYE